MTGQGPANPTDRENEINALLDGTLDETSAEALKAAAAEDSVLARAVVEAWQLQQSMDQLQLEKAPSSLRRKLRRIPYEQKAALRPLVFGLPRWLAAGGLASVVFIAVAMLMSEPGWQAVRSSQQAASRSESEAARLEQTQRELAIAFYYLDKAGLRLGQQIHQVLNDELSAPVRENLSKHMPYSGQSYKEKHV